MKYTLYYKDAKKLDLYLYFSQKLVYIEKTLMKLNLCQDIYVCMYIYIYIYIYVYIYRYTFKHAKLLKDEFFVTLIKLKLGFIFNIWEYIWT